MANFLENISISRKIILSVGLTLVALLVPLMAWIIYSELTEIRAQAGHQAETAIDMLEAVHVNSMLNRSQVEDNDPAVQTLNGTMEQFSDRSQGVKLWLVMGEKILDFQQKSGHDELEGPQDDIDRKALETASKVSETSGRWKLGRPPWIEARSPTVRVSMSPKITTSDTTTMPASAEGTAVVRRGSR